MMPVIDTWLRMFIAFATVKNDGLASEKKTTSTSSVKTGAMLRSWSARKRAQAAAAGLAGVRC